MAEGVTGCRTGKNRKLTSILWLRLDRRLVVGPFALRFRQVYIGNDLVQRRRDGHGFSDIERSGDPPDLRTRDEYLGDGVQDAPGIVRLRPFQLPREIHSQGAVIDTGVVVRVG